MGTVRREVGKVTQISRVPDSISRRLVARLPEQRKLQPSRGYGYATASMGNGVPPVLPSSTLLAPSQHPLSPGPASHGDGEWVGRGQSQEP